MPSSRVFYVAVLIFFAASGATAAEPSDGNIEGVTCYQNGQPIFKTQQRVREFRATSEMKWLTEVSIGQVQDARVKLYASDKGGVVCVVTNRN